MDVERLFVTVYAVHVNIFTICDIVLKLDKLTRHPAVLKVSFLESLRNHFSVIQTYPCIILEELLLRFVPEIGVLHEDCFL